MLDKIDNLDLGLDARNKINLAFDTIDALMLASASSSGYSTIEDEGISLINRTILNFVGPNVSVVDNGSNKTIVTITSSSVSYSENITYAALLNLFNTSALEVGKQYILTDFATKHVIPNSGGTVNTGSTESLMLLALAVNKLDHRAKSLTYPKDIIHYELVDSSTAGGDKGRIYYRENPVANISTHYDWRNVKFRRFRNAQTLTFSAGLTINQIGQKVVGGTSGALAYILGGFGSNTLRVVNISGVFQIGETVTNVNGGTVRTITNVADYSVDADTYVSNGRASSDVYTFVDSSATGMYNINIGKVSSTGPSDLLNNITFSSGSHDVSMDDDSYNLSMSACINFHTKGIFSNNYFRGGVSDMTFVSGGSSNFFYSASYGNSIFPVFSNNIIAGLFSYNKIIGYSFGLNDIAYDFQFNTIDIRFSSNVVETNSVRYNNIQADVQSKTFLYTATAITQFWTKRIINGSDGNIYLEYFDGLLLTYVDPLTA